MGDWDVGQGPEAERFAGKGPVGEVVAEPWLAKESGRVLPWVRPRRMLGYWDSVRQQAVDIAPPPRTPPGTFQNRYRMDLAHAHFGESLGELVREAFCAIRVVLADRIVADVRL